MDRVPVDNEADKRWHDPRIWRCTLRNLSLLSQIQCFDFLSATAPQKLQSENQHLCCFLRMIASKVYCPLLKPVGFGLLVIIFCVLSAGSTAATEGLLDNANNLTENGSTDETNKAAIDSDFDGENALLEVLGDEDVDQKQVDCLYPRLPIVYDLLTFKSHLAE